VDPNGTVTGAGSADSSGTDGFPSTPIPSSLLVTLTSAE
jgi:hypothetical protein